MRLSELFPAFYNGCQFCSFLDQVVTILLFLLNLINLLVTHFESEVYQTDRNSEQPSGDLLRRLMIIMFWVVYKYIWFNFYSFYIQSYKNNPRFVFQKIRRVESEMTEKIKCCLFVAQQGHISVTHETWSINSMTECWKNKYMLFNKYIKIFRTLFLTCL